VKKSQITRLIKVETIFKVFCYNTWKNCKNSCTCTEYGGRLCTGSWPPPLHPSRSYALPMESKLLRIKGKPHIKIITNTQYFALLSNTDHTELYFCS
jgi:hypothetical protein